MAGPFIPPAAEFRTLPYKIIRSYFARKLLTEFAIEIYWRFPPIDGISIDIGWPMYR